MNPARSRPRTGQVQRSCRRPERPEVDLRAGDAPAWARMRHAARSTGGGGGSNPMRQAPDRGRGGHRIRQAAASRDLWNVRGARGDGEGVLHRSRDCRGARGSGGGSGGIPCRTVNRHRNRDTIGAEQEAGGPCRVRHAAVAASDGRATASRGFTQQCGSESSSSKDGGSPSNTNPYAGPVPLTRRRARSIPRAPHRPPMRLPASRPSAFRGPSLIGMTGTASLTRPGGYATAPYRSAPTAAGCTTSPWRRTWWPRPVSRRSPPGGTSAMRRSISASPVQTSRTTAGRSRPGRTPRGAVGQATYAAQSVIRTHRRSNRSLRR